MMEFNNKIFKFFEKKANETTVEMVSLGLGYTAVKTSDGGAGIAYTYFDRKTSCSPSANYIDFESRPAIDLLNEIHATDTIRRSMALALVNALNYEAASVLPTDTRDGAYFSKFGITEGTRICMVGQFKPIVKNCEAVGAIVEVVDFHRELGDTDLTYVKLREWADVLILTSTSILNNTMEAVLDHLGPDVKTVLMGPSSPLVPEAFEGLPVHMVAGSVPVDQEGVFKAIRHGTGTPVIGKRCKKVYADIPR